jgi:hypothetical protein
MRAFGIRTLIVEPRARVLACDEQGDARAGRRRDRAAAASQPPPRPGKQEQRRHEGDEYRGEVVGEGAEEPIEKRGAAEPVDRLVEEVVHAQLTSL